MTRALERAASMVYGAGSECHWVLSLTDALSVLQALRREKLPDLGGEQGRVAADGRAVLQWVPLHCGVPGS